MHGLSIEIRLKHYLKYGVNPTRVKRGLKKLSWKEYRGDVWVNAEQSDKKVYKLVEVKPSKGGKKNG